MAPPDSPTAQSPARTPLKGSRSLASIPTFHGSEAGTVLTPHLLTSILILKGAILS